jgi:hypothetical protein
VTREIRARAHGALCFAGSSSEERTVATDTLAWIRDGVTWKVELESGIRVAHAPPGDAPPLFAGVRFTSGTEIRRLPLEYPDLSIELTTAASTGKLAEWFARAGKPPGMG